MLWHKKKMEALYSKALCKLLNDNTSGLFNAASMYCVSWSLVIGLNCKWKGMREEKGQPDCVSGMFYQ